MAIDPDRTRAKIEDVAREAGVSRSTASRVLRGLLKVLPETRDRIFAAAERVGYHPNLMARALRTGAVGTVALVLADQQLASALYSAAITTVKQALLSRRLKLIVSVVTEQEEVDEAINALFGWSDVLAMPEALASRSRILAEGEFPVILLDATAKSPDENPLADSDRIGFDQAGAMAMAVGHLVSIGHRNIAFIGGPPGVPPYELRRQGFLAGMKQAVLPVRSEWLVSCAAGQMVESAGAAFDQAVSAGRSRLSAIVCADDVLALAVAAAARRSKSRVPDDYSVIGYGDTMAARLSNPQLTTIAHSGVELGDALARIVLAHYDSPDREAEQVVLPGRIVVRDSTAPHTSHITRASVLSGTPGSAQPGRTLSDGIYEIQALHSGMLLDVPNAARTPGCHVWQWPRNGTSAQLWLVTHAEDIWYRIRNTGSWLFLDADSAMPGYCPVVTNPMNEQNPDFQLWRFEPMAADSHTFRITNKAKELVLDFAYGARFSNELAMVFAWNGGTNQQWTMHAIPFVTDEYEIVAFHSCKALDVPKQSRLPGVKPCQADRAYVLGQRWRLVHQGGAFYRIQSKLSNLNLQASGNAGTQVVLSPEDPEACDAQLWQIELVDASEPTYRLINKALETVLEIQSGEHASGASISLGDWTDAPYQRWMICDELTDADGITAAAADPRM